MDNCRRYRDLDLSVDYLLSNCKQDRTITSAIFRKPGVVR